METSDNCIEPAIHITHKSVSFFFSKTLKFLFGNVTQSHHSKYKPIFGQNSGVHPPTPRCLLIVGIRVGISLTGHFLPVQHAQSRTLSLLRSTSRNHDFYTSGVLEQLDLASTESWLSLLRPINVSKPRLLHKGVLDQLDLASLCKQVHTWYTSLFN